MIHWRFVLSKIGLTLAMGFGFVLIALVSLVPVQAESRDVPSVIGVEGQFLVRQGARFEVRGMNYYPKDFAWDKFWSNYTDTGTSAQIDQELDEASTLGVNTVRIFLPYNLFDGSDQAYLDYLADFIDRLQTRDMVAIVTLFDFYPSYAAMPYSPSDYLTSTRHISVVINTLGSTNPAVLAWDIKNEIDRDYAFFDKAQVKAWAAEMISYTRGLDPNHLITIGFYGAVPGALCYDPTITNSLVYSPAIAAEFASTVDFISMHYFLSERCFENDLQALQAVSGNKPVVLEEFGLHTLANPAISCVANPNDPLCDDPHTEAEQAAYYNTILSLSEAYGAAGYLFWTLNDFSYILANTQKSHHCQGIVRNSNVTTCEVTSTLDYTPKPAAGVVRQHYTASVAYIDLFDGWIDPNTDESPTGWSDNWQAGGALLRGYKPTELLWSHNQGKVAVSKFVTGGTSITGLVTSPVLTNVNLDRYPFLSGQVYSYSVRDSQFGTDATLHVGVQQGGQITRLLTVTPDTPLPLSFNLDLTQPPTNWRGNHDFQITFELMPEAPDNGYSAAYELDWVAITGCTPIYNRGDGWVIDLCPTDAAITTPMTITLNGDPKGQAALIRIYHQSQNGEGIPQVAVIYASGLIRLAQNADPTPAIPFGSSFILGPAYWSTNTTYYHNPQLTDLQIDTSWLPTGSLRMQAEGHNQDFDVSYLLTLPPPRDWQTRLHVVQSYTAATDISIPTIRRDNAEGFKLVQISSMFINEGDTCDSGQADCHDSNAARFIGNDLIRRQVAFSSITPTTFIYSPTIPLGSTWLDALHTDDESWQGNTPNTRIALDALPLTYTLTPQGWINAATDPNDDNVALWLHDDGPASQSWTAGQSEQVSYWLLAQDNPPDPWDDLGLRTGLTFLDFEGNSDCFPVLPGPPITGSVASIAGYNDTALQLQYNIGITNGNWAQVRCNFDPPLDLSAYDHLRFDWRGDPDAANSLEVGLINPGDSQEFIFGRGYHHPTHHHWWGQLVIPFSFLHPWTESSIFDPSQVSAMFVSIVKDPVDDVGGVGSIALDNLNAFNVLSRTSLLTFETATSHITASTAAVNWLISQKRSTGLLKSWAEESGCVSHIYDQALALLTFSREGRWTEADDLVEGLVQAQNGDGSWYKSYNCDDNALPCIHCNKWEGDIAWAIYALSRYLELDGAHPQAAAARKQGADWLLSRHNSADGCLVIDHTEGTIDAWWAFQSAGPDYVEIANEVRDCLLAEYWDDEMGRFKGGRDWQQPYLDNQTWGAAFLRAIGEDKKAHRALSYARETLHLPAQGGQLNGFDGQGGPWSVWNEGIGQFIAVGGEDANDFLLELLAQQGIDGALPGSPDDFTGGGVWTSGWHGVAPTAWFYNALNNEPFHLSQAFSITINGPTEGILQASYAFTATANSNTNLQPLTYVWQTNGQSPVTHTEGLSDTMSFSWDTSGSQVVSVTVTNAWGTVVATQTINIAVPLASVIISGPTVGYLNIPYVFTATISPTTATLPVTYTWSPIPDGGQGISDVTYVWDAPGIQAIFVTAQNVRGIVSDTHLITINGTTAITSNIYLPLILKGFDPSIIKQQGIQ